MGISEGCIVHRIFYYYSFEQSISNVKDAKKTYSLYKIKISPNPMEHDGYNIQIYEKFGNDFELEGGLKKNIVIEDNDSFAKLSGKRNIVEILWNAGYPQLTLLDEGSGYKCEYKNILQRRQMKRLDQLEKSDINELINYCDYLGETVPYEKATFRILKIFIQGYWKLRISFSDSFLFFNHLKEHIEKYEEFLYMADFIETLSDKTATYLYSIDNKNSEYRLVLEKLNKLTIMNYILKTIIYHGLGDSNSFAPF